MEEDEIKLDDTDSISEESEESLEDSISDLFEEGDTNDVETADVLTLKDFETMAGRKFSSIDDAKKHYTNLKSFVGKKVETKSPKVEAPQGMDAVLAKMSALEQTITEDKFVSTNPEAKDYLSLVKAVSKAEGLSLSDAWNSHVKETALAAAESKKGRDIGVNSKTRINPVVSQKTEKLKEAAAQGNPEATDELVNNHLKNIGLR